MPPPHPIIRTVSYQIKPKALENVIANKPPFHHLLPFFLTCKHKPQLNQIHAHMITTGLIHFPPAASKLIASFASSTLTHLAHSIADRVHGLDVYTWNTILRGYLEEKNPKQAILVYAYVRRKDLAVDSYSLLFATKACGLIGLKHVAKQVHCDIIRLGFVSEMVVVTSLLNMYGLFDDLESARRVFDETPHRDVVLWNAVVAMYAQKKFPQDAVSAFRYMVEENVRPNEVTAVSVLSACSCLQASREGKQVHGYIVKNFFSFDVYVYNALMNMYSKCGKSSSAERIFERMPVRNIISWTTMMNGYSSNNQAEKALRLFGEMDRANVRPDEVMILGIITMCSKLGNSKLVEWIDQYVEKNGVKENNVHITNALMDMHAKCGNITKACQIFYQLEGKTLVSWTTIIQGLAMHGHGVSALARFCQMQREWFRPDGILFYSILSACSHSGLVDEGRACFRSMIKDYGMKPGLMHYGCMVDLLCRAELVGEAFQFVQDMPITPDGIIWRMLLGACRNQGNVKVGKQIRDHLLDLDSNYSGNYVLLSNVYADIGEWENVENVRTEMKMKGLSKQDPGCSSIEVNSTIQ